MSWFTTALDEINAKADEIERNQVDGEYIADGMRKAVGMLTTAYVKEAEQARPLAAMYANPDDMR